MFPRIDQVLRIFTKNNGIIKNDIEGNVLVHGVVRVISHYLYLQIKKISQI